MISNRGQGGQGLWLKQTDGNGVKENPVAQEISSLVVDRKRQGPDLFSAMDSPSVYIALNCLFSASS
jgi:hypothetical protein